MKSKFLLLLISFFGVMSAYLLYANMVNASVILPLTPPIINIKITSPNGGETYTNGQPIQITWQSVGTSRVALYLSTDPQGYNTYGIVYNISDSGAYTWTANNFGLSNTTKYYIYLRGFYNGANDSVYDFSDNSFNIINAAPTPTPKQNHPPQSNLLSKYTVKKNSTVDISFKIFDIDKDKINLSITENLPNKLHLVCSRGGSELKCKLFGKYNLAGTFKINITATDEHGSKSNFKSTVVVK